MLYAVSSRRRIVRIQRQSASRESQVRNPFGNEGHDRDDPARRPASTNSRPNTANGFRRPSTPSSKRNLESNDKARIEILRDTFLLDDDDLRQFFRAFYFIAKKEDFASRASPAAARKKRGGRRNGFDDAAPSSSSDAAAETERPWEERGAAGIAISISEFFATFELSRASAHNGGFLDGVFDLVGTRDLHAVTYGEFLDGVCAFCTFKLDDAIRFVFFVLDKDKEGRIPRFQLLRFVESIHGKKVRAFERAILLPGDGEDARGDAAATPLRLPSAEKKMASVDYLALKELCANYPSMMEPVFLLQNDIRRRVMGEAWWKRKENLIEKHFRTLDRLREKERAREEKRLLGERKRNIISEIGRAPYYFRSKSREEAERGHPKPIVSLEEESGKICVEWTRTEGNDDDSKTG